MSDIRITAITPPSISALVSTPAVVNVTVIGQGARGATGVAGAQGPPGEAGVQGPQGEPGAPGGMQASTYDPAGGAKQVAFEEDSFQIVMRLGELDTEEKKVGARTNLGLQTVDGGTF